MNLIVKKIITISLSLLLATTFLMSYTGMRLLIHHCMSCDTTGLAMFSQQQSCCLDAQQDDGMILCDITTASASCCTASEDSACENCCSEEVVYLKKDFEFSNDRQQPRIEAVPVDVTADLFGDEILHSDQSNQVVSFNNTDPPPKLTGKAFVLFGHQLKIC